ncbi:hypothetical protein [Streptomyces sp. NPDC018584]|uniref:hypothetical protein n=1 Tax=unclassified Streptomyces TaxID=2593676 RepID=UPI0037A20CC9
MNPSVDALYNEARDEPAFSNSSEGMAWMDANCDTCIHEKDQRNTNNPGPGCNLILVSLMGRRPVQWIDGPRDEHGRYSMAGQYHCTEYRHEDDGPTDPQPIPDPPGQLTLVPRDDYTGTRMLLRPNPATLPAARPATVQ